MSGDRNTESAHQRMVRTIIGRVPGAKTHGFREVVSLAVTQTVMGRKRMDGGDSDRRRFRWMLHNIGSTIGGRVPDAYTIDSEQMTVTVFEVEVSTAAYNKKPAHWERVFWALDCEEWEFRLFIVNATGQMHEVNFYSLLNPDPAWALGAEFDSASLPLAHDATCAS